MTSLLTACATADSEPPVVLICPPVVEYSREFQAQAAHELDLLPESSAIAEMLSDYAVIRDQARACGNRKKSFNSMTSTSGSSIFLGLH